MQPYLSQYFYITSYFSSTDIIVYIICANLLIRIYNSKQIVVNAGRRKVLLGCSDSLCVQPLFHLLMFLVHFFSDYANLNTSPPFCEETSSVFRERRAPFALKR